MRALEAITTVFREGRRFFLVTHINPDGDGIGSMLALALALKDRGKEAWCYLDDEMPRFCRWLPGAGEIRREFPEGSDWIGVVLDCAEEKRVGKAAEFLRGLSTVVVLDHHEVTGALGTHRLIETIYATGGLVFRVLKALSWPLTPEIAENLYVAIFSDTGGFRYSQTTAETFEVARALVAAGVEPARIAERLYEHYPLSRFCLLRKALERLTLHAGGRVAMSFLGHEDFRECQAGKADPDDFASMLRSIDGVEVSALVKEYNPGEISVSLRSRGGVNVATLAKEFGEAGTGVRQDLSYKVRFLKY
jgi:phosphoesterase RecJ-like protein